MVTRAGAFDGELPASTLDSIGDRFDGVAFATLDRPAVRQSRDDWRRLEEMTEQPPAEHKDLPGIYNVGGGTIDAVINQDPGHEVRSAVRVLIAKADNVPLIESQERIRIDIFLRDNLP